MNSFLEKQNWRYATKKFDASKKVSEADLNFLKEAVRLSVSSYGLQLYKVLIVENRELRSTLQAAAYGQSQIVDASHLIVFASQTTVGEEDVNKYIANATNTRGLPTGALDGYSDYMKNALNPMSEEAKKIWTEKQTYLALGNLINAAAELKIDVCPMEGYDATQFNEILGLDKLNLTGTVVATVGYRHIEDDTQHYKKVRKSNEELFITI